VRSRIEKGVCSDDAAFVRRGSVSADVQEVCSLRARKDTAPARPGDALLTRAGGKQLPTTIPDRVERCTA